MTLDEYLERFIEGYLFEDLRSMALIKLPPGKDFGGVGYPMVMTALSGIEVLGVLTSKAGFDRNEGRLRFSEFWRDYVYEHRPDFQGLDQLVYKFVRHGLAHSFMTKPKIVVTKHRDPWHLHRYNDGVLIDALTLWQDLETAYFERLKPKIEGNLRATMVTRFREFRDAYQQDRDNNKLLFDKVPLRSTSKLPGLSSPAVTVQYSTNVTTTGFNDPNK